MKKTTLAAIAVSSLILTGCAGQAAPSETVTKTATAPASETETAEPEAETAEPVEAEPEPSLTGQDPGILKLGESFTYSDGLEITIGTPTPFTSSEWAFPESAPSLMFDVKIVNGTNAPYDPSMDFFSAQIGGAEAEEIFDTESGLDGTPMTKILPGREVAYKVGFAGTDAAGLVLEYTPGDWDRGALLYTPDGK